MTDFIKNQGYQIVNPVPGVLKNEASEIQENHIIMNHKDDKPVSYTHLTLPTICSV